MSRSLPSFSGLLALFILGLATVPTADASPVKQSTIRFTGSGIYGPSIKEAAKEFKELKLRALESEGALFETLSKRAQQANERLTALKQAAKDFEGGTITLHGVRLTKALADRIRDWFMSTKSSGGAWHVFVHEGRIRISRAPPKSTEPTPVRIDEPSRGSRRTGKPVEKGSVVDNGVQDKTNLPSEPDIFGQG